MAATAIASSTTNRDNPCNGCADAKASVIVFTMETFDTGSTETVELTPGYTSLDVCRAAVDLCCSESR
jgi:hypothetical protein